MLTTSKRSSRTISAREARDTQANPRELRTGAGGVDTRRDAATGFPVRVEASTLMAPHRSFVKPPTIAMAHSITLCLDKAMHQPSVAGL